MEFFAVLLNSLSVAGVYDVDETMSVLQVASPETPESFATADIPNSQVESRMFDSLYVKADCRNDIIDFTMLKLVKNASFANPVETEHQEAHLSSFHLSCNRLRLLLL